MMTGSASHENFRNRLLKSMLQVLLLVLAGILFGAVSNTLRHDRLPWVGDFSPPQVAAAVHPMNVHEAWVDYQKGLVQFVDARSHSEFVAGHLPGAVNVPVEQAEAGAGNVQLPAGKTLVIYCVDPDCPKSEQLAALLSKRGVKGLRVMPEGWIGWHEAGLPYEGKGE